MKQFLHELISNCEHPDQLVELLYWSREPELAQTMRELVALPPDAKAALRAFFQLAQSNLESFAASVDGNGDLTLSSSTVANLLQVSGRPSNEQSSEALH